MRLKRALALDSEANDGRGANGRRRTPGAARTIAIGLVVDSGCDELHRAPRLGLLRGHAECLARFAFQPATHPDRRLPKTLFDRARRPLARTVSPQRVTRRQSSNQPLYIPLDP